MATNYTLSYSNTNTECFTDTGTIPRITGGNKMLTGLEKGTEYSITVTASLTGGRTERDTIRATTLTAG